MARAHDPTPRDYRRFDALFWGPGGVYEDYRRRRWEGSVASLLFTRYHRFHSHGQRWGLAFSVSVWTKNLQAAISLYPEPLLGMKVTPRIQATGFYENLAAFFELLGYERGWVAPRGNIQYTRILSKMSEVGPLLVQFRELDLRIGTPRPGPKATPGGPQEHFRELLRWARGQRRNGWRVSFAEFHVPSEESAGGVRWRIRKDVLVSPTNSCTWFYVWPPKSFGRSDWKRLGKEGFLDRGARELKDLGQEGYWRPGLFTDPDRLAAEFWKPEYDPRISRKDFEALLDWRLPNSYFS